MTPEGGVHGGGSGVGFSVQGHAGRAAKGSDVVCAAISAIAQTAVAAITRVAGVSQDVTQREGVLETSVHVAGLGPEALRDLQVIVRTMMIGLDEVRRLHPESITIDFDCEVRLWHIKKAAVQHGTGAIRIPNGWA